MTHIETMKQALDALEQVASEMTVGFRYTNAGQSVLDVLPALRAAIEQGEHRCKFPTCQNESYQAVLAEQIIRELYTGQPKSEPVAWRLAHRIYTSLEDAEYDWRHDPAFQNTSYVPEPLYVVPVSYVPLTDIAHK